MPHEIARTDRLCLRAYTTADEADRRGVYNGLADSVRMRPSERSDISLPMLNHLFRTVFHLFLPFALLVGYLPATASAQTATANEPGEWFRAYKDWLRKITPEQMEKGKDPLGVLNVMYKERLQATGLTAAQVQERWASVTRQAAADPEVTRLRTNLRYAGGWYEGDPPSSALRDFVKGRAPGRALDCGMGSGRNAVLLASMGWQVTGLDLSDTAVEQARALAARAGVGIQAVQSTYAGFAWGKEQWDLIVNVDAQDGFGTPNWPASSTFFSAPLVDSLTPRGVLYVEAHINADGVNRLGGLGRLFPALRVLKEEVINDPVWEEHSKSANLQERWKWPGTAKVAVFVAEKPSDHKQ